MLISNQLSSFVMMVASSILAVPQPAKSQPISKGVKNIVLVHGAFADGSSWSKVVSKLQAKGYHVIAAQNPLTTFEEDVAAAKRAIAQMDGPVLLVGHSYAGLIISEAGKDPQVAGLVYVSALVPEDGQSASDINAAMPTTGVEKFFQLSDDGFLSLPEKAVNEYFAQDATDEERKIIFATQVPWAAVITTQKVNDPAWKTKPVWQIISAKDGMINPDLQRFKSKIIKAKTLELNVGHVPMVSQPGEVADFIAAAAGTL